MVAETTTRISVYRSCRHNAENHRASHTRDPLVIEDVSLSGPTGPNPSRYTYLLTTLVVPSYVPKSVLALI